MRGATALAEWVGPHRPVTTKRVLRRADVPAACAAMGVAAPRRLRSAADVPDLHHPWTAAIGAGLLRVEGGRVVPGPALAGWPSATADDVLAGWSRGLAAGLADVYQESDHADAAEIGRSALAVLAADPAPTGGDLLRAIMAHLLATDRTLTWIFNHSGRIVDPVDAVMNPLAAFGAVDRAGGRWRVTPLGRWVLARGFDLTGAAPAVEGICRLKVTLRYVRPACWRRVLVPSDVTLGDLHEVIRIAFAWDDEHLHLFTVGPRRYGNPFFGCDYDEDAITLSAALARTRTPIRYVYDLGDGWEHEIVLEKTVEPDASLTYPICVDGRGDSPVEDWNEEFDDAAWIPFDLEDINTRLARLGSSGVSRPAI